ncbi:uncharacterized protein LOC134180506 isoform X2 [Corticium candelabrum]|uniref:uncharacterized protein LOC134180506 isoform X2 n=1 Tax=Corticium candelabrum TaxID=121492 RepID=UPI002E25B6DE|nr:uncharacterized protein LOC134180506 isoform X2 [Corticium candelabrum]
MTEVDWLFSTCVPPVLLQLEEWMEECIKIYEEECSRGKDSSSQQKSFVLKSKDVENLRGFVNLQGSVITKGTVRIGKGSRSAKQDVKHDLSTKTPWYISQIREMISNVKAAFRALQGRRVHLVDIKDAVEVTKLVLGYVHKAQSCLTVPPDDLRQLWEMKSMVTFKPDLSTSELIVFTINASKLVLSYLTFAAVSSSQASGKGTVEIRGQHYEVSQRLSVSLALN